LSGEVKPHFSLFRRRFAGGQNLVGSFIKTPTTHATEIFGALGYDFVVIDEEHAPFDRAVTDVVVLAARASNLASIVRVSSDDPTKILSCLDCGAAGVLVPHVASVEKARAVAAVARYRGGRRGYSGSPRAGGYGATPMWQLVEEQDASVCVIAMIEDPEALDHIDAIAAVDGIHGLFIGRGDLTVSLGVKSSADPKVGDAVKRIIAAAKQASKPVCVMVASAAEAKDFADLGASAFIISSDQGQMRRAAAQSFAEFKQLVQTRETPMYHSTDPRTALAATPVGISPSPTHFAGAEYAKFYDMAPAEEKEGARNWYARGQNFIIAYSEGGNGAVLSRAEQPDEYVVLLPDPGAGAEIAWGNERITVSGHSISFVPTGKSSVTLLGPAKIIRMMTTKSLDVAALCSNAESYASAHPNLPPFEPWPEPAGGPRIRSYSLDVKPVPGRFGRIWRGSTFMVNFLDPKNGPRDTSKMSPHHHDDFEQCSLALAGNFIHHMRWPWTPDMAQWREDTHERCGSPSIAVIPPPAIHTSQAMDSGLNLLVDVFCPPREDFSAKPGWVLNADDYPMPHSLKGI
jgi:2-keto-3-deoxy-L-rhamnonate aldolase RhmA